MSSVNSAPDLSFPLVKMALVTPFYKVGMGVKGVFSVASDFYLLPYGTGNVLASGGWT